MKQYPEEYGRDYFRLILVAEFFLHGPKWRISFSLIWLFHDGGLYHIETSPLICRANRWTGFYIKGAYDMKELKKRMNTSR